LYYKMQWPAKVLEFVCTSSPPFFVEKNKGAT
jgi:hypothetical protein